MVPRSGQFQWAVGNDRQATANAVGCPYARHGRPTPTPFEADWAASVGWGCCCRLSSRLEAFEFTAEVPSPSTVPRGKIRCSRFWEAVRNCLRQPQYAIALNIKLRGPVHVALPAEPAELPVLLAAAAAHEQGGLQLHIPCRSSVLA